MAASSSPRSWSRSSGTCPGLDGLEALRVLRRALGILHRRSRDRIARTPNSPWQDRLVVETMRAIRKRDAEPGLVLDELGTAPGRTRS